MVREYRSILDVVDGRYTHIDGKLAAIYGIKDTKGNYWSTPKPTPGGQNIPWDKFVRVELPADGLRAGILTQASILTVTSNPTRTSPVKRGRWVLEQVLGTPPPPPPPNVPELKEDPKAISSGSLRQRMEEERAKSGEKGPSKLTRKVAVPAKITTAADIDAVIQQLHEIKAQVGLYSEIEVTFSVGNGGEQ